MRKLTALAATATKVGDAVRTARQQSMTGRKIMQIKSILAGAAIALATTVGSAYAADQFTTLDGVTAVPMSSGELDTITGTHRHWVITLPSGDMEVHVSTFVAAGFSVSHGDGQSFQGGHMQNAEGAGGVLDICNFGGDGVSC